MKLRQRIAQESEETADSSKLTSKESHEMTGITSQYVKEKITFNSRPMRYSYFIQHRLIHLDMGSSKPREDKKGIVIPGVCRTAPLPEGELGKI